MDGWRCCEGLGRRDRQRHDDRALVPAHDGIEPTRRIIKAEHPLGQLRLHAEHVDQKSQSAEVVGQALEQFTRAGALGIDLGVGQRIDLVAHAQASQRRLIQAQHGQDATHRRHLARHRDQQLTLARVAEVVVRMTLDLGQAGAQLVHHAAQSLTIRHPAVQLLHPGFQRLGRFAMGDGLDAGGQALHPQGLFRLVERGVVEGRFHIQHAGGNLHRQRGCRWLAGTQGRHDGALQGLAQHLTAGEKACK